jgi:hypothetical protein
MRRFLLALAVVTAVLVPVASASATAYSTGPNFMHFGTPFGGDFTCRNAGLAVTGSAAVMSFSVCRWLPASITTTFSCTTATYTATSLSAINCGGSITGSGSCNPAFRFSGSVPLTGAITVLNAGQSLTADIVNSAACNTVFRLTATDPHSYAMTWGSASGGTGDIPFV